MGAASAYLELTKPRLSALVLVTTAAGFWLGASSSTAPLLLARVLLGTALVAAGANALNQWMEREPDALMRRTSRRPLPSGQLQPEAARRFGLGLVIAGVLYLAAAVNSLSAWLGVAATVSYLACYTPLKRVTSLCTLVGAIPGALPPLIGWAAARHSLGPQAWTLFALLFIWQLPHFLAIAVLYRQDYAQAGFKMLPVVDCDGGATARQTALYGLALVPLSAFPVLMRLSGPWAGYGAMAVSLAFLVMTLRAARYRSLQACQQLFLASLVYLPVLLGLLIWDKRVG